MYGHSRGTSHAFHSSKASLNRALRCSSPFNLLKWLPVGGRSTAIKLNNGSLWLIASTPLNGETKEKLKELGDDVR